MYLLIPITYSPIHARIKDVFLSQYITLSILFDFDFKTFTVGTLFYPFNCILPYIICIKYFLRNKDAFGKFNLRVQR